MKRVFIVLIAISLSTLVLVGCGSQGSQDTGTGTIAFRAQWLGAGQTSRHAKAAVAAETAPEIFKTAPAGVTTIRMTISSTGMTAITATFSASAGQGTITGVPAGTGRKLLILGLNASNSVVYLGVAYSITVTAGQTTNAGTITMAPVMTGGLPVPWQVAVDSSNIYWTQRGNVDSAGNIISGTGAIVKMNIATGVMTTLASGLSDPIGIDVDSVYVYWTEYATGTTGAGSVKKISISGGVSTTLASGLSSPWGIVIDSANVYWAENTSSGAIKKVSTSGGSITTLASGLIWPFAVAVDSTSVYWSEEPSNGGSVKKIAITGGTPTVLATSTSSPQYLAVDATSVYYTEYGTEDASGNINASSGSLKKVSISGGTPTTLATGLNYPKGVAVTAANVYFTEWGSSVGSVKYVPLAGGTATPVSITLANGSTAPATGLNAPYSVAVDTGGTYVYWTESGSGSIKRSLIGTITPSPPTNVMAAPANAQNFISWTASSGATSYNIYWASTSANATKAFGTKITGVSSPYNHTLLSNNTPYYYVVTAVSGGAESVESSPVASATPSASIAVLASSLSSPYGVVVDSTSTNAYWTESTTVKKVNLSTLTPSTLIADETSPNYVAVDATNAYFTDWSGGTIKKTNLSTLATTTLASGLNNPDNITVDSTYVYWTEYAGGTAGSGAVKRVPIAGGTVTIIASALNSPTGIAIDGTSASVSTYVYFTENTSSGTLKKVPSAGGTVTTLALSLSFPYDVAIDASYAYWSETGGIGTGTGAVKKVPLGGGTVTTLASSLSDPYDIDVDTSNVYWIQAPATGGSVKAVSLSGGAPTTIALTANPGDITIDSTNVYWTDINSGTVMKAVKLGGTPATNVWTWVSGGNTVNQIGIYGTKGTPSGTNIPGARSSAVSWIDINNNRWLFGGSGVDSAGTSGALNDLWKFDGTNWTWVSGSNIVNQSAVYGTKGTGAGTNMPGAHYDSVSWRDSSNNLWLFGGASASNIYLNDLWKYDGTNWTWVSGSNLTNQSGVYGTKGVAAGTNVPGARYYAVSWIDSANILWLFGGQGHDSAGTLGYLNDLWKFDGINWTWVSGSNIVNQIGVYGTKGTAAGTNVPGGRNGATTWIDSSNIRWLFGGYGYDSIGSIGYLNDLWKFDGTNWTWVSGANLANQASTYGTKGTAAGTNVPGGRCYVGASWVDGSNNLWLLGGSSSTGLLNDLWKFDGINWTWVSGVNTVNQIGSYGTKGTAAAANVPGAREAGVSWRDSSNNLWIFGGMGYDYLGGTTGNLNDLWRYQP